MKPVEKRDYDKELSNHISRLARRELIAEHSLHGRKHRFHPPAFSVASSLTPVLFSLLFTLLLAGDAREREEELLLNLKSGLCPLLPAHSLSICYYVQLYPFLYS